MQNWFKVFFLFFTLGLLVYFNSLNNKFLMDDYVFMRNPFFSSTKFILSQWDPYGQQALGVLDLHAELSYYRPMALMVTDFCYAAFKNNFWQYHLLNLFLFVLASSLIYPLIGRISGNYNLAFLTSIFYLIHPINGELVNYIDANGSSFQLIFTLGVILLLWGSLERKNNRTLYFLSLLLSFLSLFWHESAIMTPFYLSAVILLFRKGHFKEKALYLFPYFLIVFSYLIFRSFFIGIDGFIKQMAQFHMTVWEYLGALFRIFMWYITKLFYPKGIVMQWATPILSDHIIWYAWGACLLFTLLLLLFVRFSKERILQMAVIWIAAGFAPVCLAAFIRPSNGVEIETHWFVVSSIGFFILAAHFFLIILGRAKKAGLVLLLMVIFAWGGISHAYNQIWVDQKTYARFWSQQAPDLKITYIYLVEAYETEGSFKEARKYFKLPLRDYLSADIYLNLGAMDAGEKHWKEAELDYRMALKINPYYVDAYYNLGAIYVKQGQWEKAKAYFLQALIYNPLMLEPRRGLAIIALKHAEYQKAVKLCLKNLDIVNDDTDTLFLLIDIFMREQDFVSLKKYAYRLINHETDPEILTRLGVIMSRKNIVDIALDSYMKAIHVAPDYKDAYLDAGTLFGNLGKYDQAIHIWKLGSGIDPLDQRFKNSIARAITLKSKN